jgi:hypothetical protein
MWPSKSASVKCAKWVSAVTQQYRALRLSVRKLLPYGFLRSFTMPFRYLLKLVKEGSIDEFLPCEGGYYCNSTSSPISSVNHQATNVLLAFTVREAKISSRSLALRDFTWKMDLTRLREISNTAIPHRKTPQICSVNVKSAVNTTTEKRHRVQVLLPMSKWIYLTSWIS